MAGKITPSDTPLVAFKTDEAKLKHQEMLLANEARVSTAKCRIAYAVTATCCLSLAWAVWKNDPTIYAIVLPTVSWIAGFAAGKI